MITERDLQEAIAECQGERNPNANTCIKLAAFYTIRNEMFPEQVVSKSAITDDSAATVREIPNVGYSYDPGPVENTIDYQSDSEFSRIIDGRDPAEIWPVMDELMDTLMVIHRRLYDGVMRQLQK